MIDRTPTARDQRAPLPAFEPVPRRKPRHDGWTPERQVAFIEALADTGSVTRAAAQVNMSTESAYFLRRQPGAEGFARAWEAALDMGVLRLKDEAFDRAMTGDLVPIIAAGKLLGYRRQRNDRLIMFILRHYGQSPQTGGFRPARPGPQPQAEPRPARRRRAAPETITAPTDPTAAATPAHAILTAFAGLDLDAETQEQVIAVLAAGAARSRALAEANNSADNPATAFIRTAQMPWDHPAALDAFGQSTLLDCGDADAGDQCWQMLDLPDDRDERDRLAVEYAARQHLDPPAEAPAIPAPDPAPPPPPAPPTPTPAATDQPKDSLDRWADWVLAGCPPVEWRKDEW
jgi:hypothetical protein